MVDDIQILLEELYKVYREVRQTRMRWENLQTVDLARAEYEKLIAQEEGKLEALQKRKKVLGEEKRMLVLAPELDKDAFESRRGPGPVQIKRWHSPQVRTVKPAQVETNHLARLAERHQLKKLVNRWKYSWHLDSAVLGQINRIADDFERPLGEALVLLDWSIFADRTRTQESSEMYLARLSQWRVSLMEYHDWLEREIGSLEMRFRGWLHVWELWCARDQSTESQELWMAFITESCRAKQDEIVKLELEIAHLTEEINLLKGHVQNTGGLA